MNQPRQATSAPQASSAERIALGPILLRVAWLSILLGFMMEILLLLLATGSGILSGLAPVAADLIRQISWASLVCLGLALGTAASKVRVPLMGLLGLLTAPLAFSISRRLHQGAVQTLEIAGAGSEAVPVLLLALLKGIEYSCLGMALGWVGTRPWGGVMVHVAVGLTTGLVFGGAVLALTYQATPDILNSVDLVSRGVNELLFPIGCSLVLFFARDLAERARQ